MRDREEPEGGWKAGTSDKNEETEHVTKIGRSEVVSNAFLNEDAHKNAYQGIETIRPSCRSFIPL